MLVVMPRKWSFWMICRSVEGIRFKQHPGRSCAISFLFCRRRIISFGTCLVWLPYSLGGGEEEGSTEISHEIRSL